MIKRALISVYDKSGLEKLIEILGLYGVEVVSSGGTAGRIGELGYKKLRKVEEYTGHPESPGGLLKTLHPKVHGGLLLDPDDPEHERYMEKYGIEPFDLIVVNLYPFQTAVEGGAGIKEAAENIDIGGSTMIRAAAKAALLYDRAAVVVDPTQYGEIIEALSENSGSIPSPLRKRLAEKAFKRTAWYDSAIVEYLKDVM
jgi:phosphoribosylaminoimidazolecarboxamide formyltransferase/IMP cyclohydrolase